MITSPWIRTDGDLDIHFDCEFIDDHDGFSFISIGAVLATNSKTSTFYGLSSGFFKSPKFESVMRTNNTQNTWMTDNVFRHIVGTVSARNHEGEETYRQGNIKELRDMMQKSASFKFNPGLDQTYVIMSGSREVGQEEPDVVVVGDAKKLSSELVHAIHSTIGGKDNLVTVRLFCYYGAYDQYALNRLFGGMLEAPEKFNHMNYDIRSLGDAFGYEHDEFNDTTPHHALSDAVVQYGMMRRLRNKIVKKHGLSLFPEKMHNDKALINLINTEW